MMMIMMDYNYSDILMMIMMVYKGVSRFDLTGHDFSFIARL